MFEIQIKRVIMNSGATSHAPLLCLLTNSVWAQRLYLYCFLTIARASLQMAGFQDDAESSAAAAARVRVSGDSHDSAYEQ